MKGLYDSIGKLPVYQRYLVFGVVIAAIIGGFWYFIYNPNTEQIAQMNKKLADLTKTLETTKIEAARLEQFEADVKQLEGDLKTLLAQLPDSKEIPELLRQIDQTGKKSGLEFTLFQPLDKISRNFYAEVPVKLEIVGRFHDVATFFDGIGKLDRIVNISDIQIREPRWSGDSVLMRIECLATAFMFTEGGEAAKPQASAARPPAAPRR